MNTHDQPWVLMSSHEHSWAWRHGTRSTHESSRAVMRGHGHSLAFLRTDGAIAPYSWMLMSANKRWCALISTHEGSLEIMSANVLHWTINQNVKDGISRPLGSREIQKPKVNTNWGNHLHISNGVLLLVNITHIHKYETNLFYWGRGSSNIWYLYLVRLLETNTLVIYIRSDS